MAIGIGQKSYPFNYNAIVSFVPRQAGVYVLFNANWFYVGESDDLEEGQAHPFGHSCISGLGDLLLSDRVLMPRVRHQLIERVDGELPVLHARQNVELLDGEDSWRFLHHLAVLQLAVAEERELDFLLFAVGEEVVDEGALA